MISSRADRTLRVLAGVLLAVVCALGPAPARAQADEVMSAPACDADPRRCATACAAAYDDFAKIYSSFDRTKQKRKSYADFAAATLMARDCGFRADEPHRTGPEWQAIKRMTTVRDTAAACHRIVVEAGKLAPGSQPHATMFSQYRLCTIGEELSRFTGEQETACRSEDAEAKRLLAASDYARMFRYVENGDCLQHRYEVREAYLKLERNEPEKHADAIAAVHGKDYLEDLLSSRAAGRAPEPPAMRPPAVPPAPDVDMVAACRRLGEEWTAAAAALRIADIRHYARKAAHCTSDEALADPAVAAMFDAIELCDYAASSLGRIGAADARALARLVERAECAPVVREAERRLAALRARPPAQDACTAEAHKLAAIVETGTLAELEDFRSVASCEAVVGNLAVSRNTLCRRQRAEIDELAAENFSDVNALKRRFDCFDAANELQRRHALWSSTRQETQACDAEKARYAAVTASTDYDALADALDGFQCPAYHEAVAISLDRICDDEARAIGALPRDSAALIEQFARSVQCPDVRERAGKLVASLRAEEACGAAERELQAIRDDDLSALRVFARRELCRSLAEEVEERIAHAELVLLCRSDSARLRAISDHDVNALTRFRSDCPGLQAQAERRAAAARKSNGGRDRTATYEQRTSVEPRTDSGAFAIESLLRSLDADDAPSPPKYTQRLNEDGVEIDGGRPAGAGPPSGQRVSIAEVIAPQPAPRTVSNMTSAAQRAIFYEERTTDDQQTAEQGNVVWSLVQESPGNDLPPEAAIRAEATIPGNGLQFRMTIRRNADKTLPASHIVELIFLTPEDFQGIAIDNVLRTTMKETEEATGNPLLGIPAKIGDGFFLIALSDGVPEIEANLSLMRRGGWIDIPVVYGNGRRALLTLERGLSGASIFNAALNDWAYVGRPWQVEVASRLSQEEAQSALNELRSRHKELLHAKRTTVTSIEIPGKGTFWRVRVAATSKQDANMLCANLKQSGGDCFVAR